MGVVEEFCKEHSYSRENSVFVSLLAVNERTKEVLEEAPYKTFYRPPAVDNKYFWVRKGELVIGVDYEKASGKIVDARLEEWTEHHQRVAENFPYALALEEHDVGNRALTLP